MKYIGVPCMCERVSYNKERLLINMVLETISYISVRWHDARDRFRARSQCTTLSWVDKHVRCSFSAKGTTPVLPSGGIWNYFSIIAIPNNCIYPIKQNVSFSGDQSVFAPLCWFRHYSCFNRSLWKCSSFHLVKNAMCEAMASPRWLVTECLLR